MRANEMGTGIITKQGIFSDRLSTQELQIVQARQNTSIVNKENAKTLCERCIDIVNRAFIDSGITIKGNGDNEQAATVFQIASSFADDLKQYFPTITIKEVEYAVRTGIREVYGKYFGINVATLNKFVRAYLESEELNEAVRKQKLFLSEAKCDETKPTEAEIYAFMKQSCINDFAYYKRTKRLIDNGNPKYSFLKEAGIINFSIERMQAIFNRVLAEQTARAKVDRLNSDVNSFSRDIAEIVIKQGDKSELVKSAARLEALKVFFDDLIETGTELTDLF